ncbi:unnamed protein product [Parascedosporium putredinis]|uniref:Dynactin subunit 5 n=1 Tax=Parascedosporium putredinis TaxID=1442378 RepID=A0A9P1GXL4_9PEZI|nr:unnamed protein product [Parascedosporium putredinis]CAI7989936.1 unnamed protein product [Parascedosporium putredinis]
MSRRPAKGEYIETDTGNKVARKAILVGTQNIMLGGKSVIQPEAMIRGDLVRSQPSSGSLLRPPGRLFKGVYSHMPLRMGDHVFVGERTAVRAASIGSHVHIGHNVVIGEFAIIKDYVKILDNTVVPPTW